MNNKHAKEHSLLQLNFNKKDTFLKLLKKIEIMKLIEVAGLPNANTISDCYTFAK